MNKGHVGTEPTIPLLVRVDVGTDHTCRLTLNPLFILVAQAQMESIQRITKIFGLRRLI